MPHLCYLTAYTLLTLTAATLASKAANLTTAAVPVGAVIDRCSTPGTIALTFDDGPFMYTNDLLEILGGYGAPCTFFLNGHGLGDIYEYADVVRRIVNEGHQLGSHTCVFCPGVIDWVRLIIDDAAGTTSISPRSTTTVS